MLTRRHGQYILLVLIVLFVGMCCADSDAQEDCQHGTLSCVNAAVQRIWSMGWDFHTSAQVVLPEDAVYYHGIWEAPTTGTPAVRYRVRVEFLVDGLREVEFFLTSAGDSARMQCVGIDSLDRAGPWSEWSDGP